MATCCTSQGFPGTTFKSVSAYMHTLFSMCLVAGEGIGRFLCIWQFTMTRQTLSNSWCSFYLMYCTSPCLDGILLLLVSVGINVLQCQGAVSWLEFEQSATFTSGKLLLKEGTLGRVETMSQWQSLKCFPVKLLQWKELVSLSGIHPDNVQYVYLAAPTLVKKLPISPLLAEMRTRVCVYVCKQTD